MPDGIFERFAVGEPIGVGDGGGHLPHLSALARGESQGGRSLALGRPQEERELAVAGDGGQINIQWGDMELSTDFKAK